jgi:hypothetical protein
MDIRQFGPGQSLYLLASTTDLGVAVALLWCRLIAVTILQGATNRRMPSWSLRMHQMMLGLVVVVVALAEVRSHVISPAILSEIHQPATSFGIFAM